MENRQINQVMDRIETNIRSCEILRLLLQMRLVGDNIDYAWYHCKGYGHEEVKIGIQLIDLYIKLKNYIDSFI